MSAANFESHQDGCRERDHGGTRVKDALLLFCLLFIDAKISQLTEFLKQISKSIVCYWKN